MEQSKDNKAIPMTSVSSGKGKEVALGVYYYTNQIVNVVMLGVPGAGEWVLIDAGMPKSGDELIRVATERFGKAPAAIILTHGHFDHVGSVVDLIYEWNVPVYAHPLEFPYLTGRKAYPEPDTSVEGGMLAKISSIYPNEPIDITEKLQVLPEDGTLPFLPDWRWMHVPGHSPGQVALYREKDGVLLSADALITVRQDSFYRVLIQKEEVCGPPVYLTTDWKEAHDSVLRLASLNPNILVSGHGQYIQGEDLRAGLEDLVQNWEKLAVPDHGKFVDRKDS